MSATWPFIALILYSVCVSQFLVNFMLRYLINDKVPVEMQDEFGWNAAMKAIGRCSKCLEELLNKNNLVAEERLPEGCNRGPRRFQSDRCKTNYTLVHFAAQKNDVNSMNILKQHNVDSRIDFVHVKPTLPSILVMNYQKLCLLKLWPDQVHALTNSGPKYFKQPNAKVCWEHSRSRGCERSS